MNDLVAAIDCGTNSTRLLIGDGINTTERRMTITRLGQGVDSSGVLNKEAIGRVAKVLEEYREILDTYQVERIRMTATSAARDASNSKDFFDLAERIIGVRPELLSGIEEGRLSFAGATRGL
ncbi:MAG TPA: exopolyphosphatase, partial [Acidimicrobiales bacterium]|nr:exopolyphosphatase [Acidimicrobiales bacterium]